MGYHHYTLLEDTREEAFIGKNETTATTEKRDYVVVLVGLNKV